MTKQGSRADTRRKALRDELWPGLEGQVFDLSKADIAGYVRMPRVVPAMAALLNTLGGKLNAGPLYSALWAADYGQGLIEVTDYRQLLFDAGYSITGRARRTWDERIGIMKKFNFIDTKSNGIEQDGFILLFDPFRVAAQLHVKSESDSSLKESMPDTDWWEPFSARCKKIGVPLGPLVEEARAMRK